MYVACIYNVFINTNAGSLMRTYEICLNRIELLHELIFGMYKLKVSNSSTLSIDIPVKSKRVAPKYEAKEKKKRGDDC